MSHVEDVSETWVDRTDTPWQQIAELIPHIVWMASPDGKTEYLNRQATEYLGWPPGEPLDDVWATVLHPDDLASARRTWLHAVRTRTRYTAEYRLRGADGHYRWHCGRGLPIGGARGEAARWIGTATDIEDQKRSAAALEENNDRLAEAQRLAHVGSWYVDVASGTYRWSEEMYRLLGYEPGQFPPDPERVLERVHPADASRVRAVIEARTARPEAREDEFRIVLPGTGQRWVVARSELELHGSEVTVGIHGTTQDVTERKHYEEQVRFQANLLDAVGEAVVATDLKANVIYWGPGAEELYGWKAEEAEGRGVMDLIPTVHASYAPTEVLAHLAGGDRWAGTMELGRRDGSSFIAQVSRTPVFESDGSLIAVIGISCDVSAREEAKAELERAHRTAEEALTLLGTLQAEAPVGFGFIDRELRYVRVNEALAAIIGAPAEEVIGRRVVDVVLPELWERLEPSYRRVLDAGVAARNRPLVGLQNLGGEVREWLASHYPVRVDDEIIGIGVIVHDVTDRARSEGFRSAVMSQVVDGVYTQDCDGLLTYMNRAASKLLGWTEGELRGKHMHEVVHLHTSDSTRAGDAECALLTQGQRGRLERSVGESFTRKDGSTFPVAYSSVPLCVGSAVEGVAVVFRDVSEPGSSPNVIRVLIVDSDRNAAASFQALLDRHEGIDVVEVATTSASAIDTAARLRPDVVLVNAELPDLDGLATTLAMKENDPSIRVILVSEEHDDTTAIAGIEAGCAGVLDKSRAWVELVSAVRAAYHGETIISQDELRRVLSKLREGGDRGRAGHLTDREDEVLACMREGLTNGQVAERLGVTANTVRNHVQRILYKLNVHSKLEAVVLSSRDGLQQGRS